MEIPSAILIPINGHTTQDVLKGASGNTFISWDRLLPDIKHKIMHKGNEEIVGLIIDNKGILVSIKYKNEI